MQSGDRPKRRRIGRAALALTVATAALCMALVVPGVAAASTPTPPDNPSANIPSPFIGWTGCGGPGSGGVGVEDCTNPCATLLPTMQIVSIPATDQCVESVLQAINSAHTAEGIPPITLPSNWFSLTTPEHLFVIANLERISMGETPFIGLTTALNADAQTAANNKTDPTDPPGAVWFGGAWAGGPLGALVADFLWMYDDGYPGPNLACTTPTSSGCWGHRDNILGQPQCTPCYMGAGAAGGDSYADVFVETQDTQPCTFTWATDVVPYLANGITVLPGKTLTSYDFVQNQLPLAGPVVGIASTPVGQGYWTVDAQGYVAAYGDAMNYGGMGGQPLNAPISHIVSTPDGEGYWLVAADGGVFSFGNAQFYGSMGGYPLNAPVMDIIPTANGGGYWLVATDGGVFAFGNAQFYGSMGGTHLNAPVNGGSYAQGGYRMVANDGGIFDFGGAQFYGSMGGKPLNRPIVGMADTPDGAGYWLVASDGGIFSFGNAKFYGSTGGSPPSTPIAGMAVDDTTGGYWLVDQAGQVFGFNAPVLSPAV